jgi:hypothetical protein
MFFSRHRHRRRDGFRFVLLTCLLTCLLLAVDGVLVSGIYTQLALEDGIWNRYPKLTQAIAFAIPLLLVVIQWWLIDLASQFLARRRAKLSEEPGETVS